MPKNLFIVIDGLDGAGKGEMIAKLHNYIFSKSKKYRILTTREPTSGKYGMKIRAILKEEKDPMANPELLLDLYVKDRIEHLKETIIPFLNQSNGDTTNIVLCDRYYYSMIAFQYTQGINLNKLVQLIKIFKKPDIVFIMDIDAKKALGRINKSRQNSEKFEDFDFMSKLRKNFLKLKGILPNENICIIDASKSKEDVFNQIKREIDMLL